MNTQPIGDAIETLLDYVENNKTFQTGNMMTVPAAKYTDPDERSAEIELIFKRLPLMLAVSCELPKPGDYKAIEVVGMPILIVREKSGTVRAFLNVCAHRWAPVAAEGLGHCANSRFVCPFHGWTFGTDGKLISVTDRAKFGDIDKAAHGLKELPCEERYGMIFACLTPGAPLDLASYYGDLLEEFADFKLQDCEFLESIELEGPNWKIVCTNLFESYHIAAAHPKTLAPFFVSDVNHYEGFGPNQRIGFAQRAITRLREVPRPQWDQQEGSGFVFMRHFFPNVTFTVSLHGVSIFTLIFPGPTPDRSRIVLLIIRKAQPGDEADRDKIKKEIAAGIQHGTFTVLRDEDLATGIATQKGLGSNAHEGLLYGHNERGPQYFHEWVDWYLQRNPSMPKPVL